MTPILQIKELTVAYYHRRQWLNAVRDFSLDIPAGQTCGLVGESGSGKSTIALAIMRYLQGGKIQQGQIEFDGRNLLALPESEMRQVWGAQIALVPQDPLSALNPSIRIGEQLAEILRHHNQLPAGQANQRALELLGMVRVPDPQRVANSYPHQISGGMQQRVMIAAALSTEPKLMILDEPTTALDVTTQATILDLFRDLIRQRGTAALYVTHNLGVVARICDRVVVLYAGELVEDAPTTDLFRRPLHPYTQGLLDSVPQVGNNKGQNRLQAIPGRIPALESRPAGCLYAARCPLVLPRCHQERPALETVADGRRVRCHRWPEIAAGQVTARLTHIAATTQTSPVPAGAPVLTVADLAVHFQLRRSIADLLTGRAAPQVKAVDGVDLTIQPAKTLGLVGESGSGKTTLARAVIGLEEKTAGQMSLLANELPSGLPGRGREILGQLQIVFQNPAEALNPYLTIGETLRRPLMALLGQNRAEADKNVQTLLAAVRLPAGYAQRLPDQLSGGEKQRVAIARAFAANPALLIGDEPVSALDVSVQASILNLLNELQQERQNAILFISHDLAVVGYLADEIAVIYVGRLLEFGKATDLFQPPYHPYTEALLSAIPNPNPDQQPTQIRLEGDVPNQMNVPAGCPFHPRCPRYLGPICASQSPPWQKTANGKAIFCHIRPDELYQLQTSSQL